LTQNKFAADKLSDHDRKMCRLYAWKLATHTTDAGMDSLPRALGDELPSLYYMRERIRFLSGVEPQYYDCCVQSCCAFTGPNETLSHCPYCKEARWREDGKPRKIYVYIPLIPRLVGFAQNLHFVELMQYRARHSASYREGEMHDFFDRDHYRNLCKRFVHVGQSLAHKFFNDARDIALGASSDGFAPHRRRKSTAWPLILFNYNLPPDIRFHINNIIAVAVIPGPKKPKDIDTFLWPLLRELLHVVE